VPGGLPVKLGAVFLSLGLVALVLQGVIATLIQPPWCPDLALLVLVGIGLRWGSLSSGLPLAALLGYATDVLSGSLLGQHALLYPVAFGVTLLATRQLNLRGVRPLSFFVVALTVLYGVGMLAITGFFIGGVEIRVGWLSAQLIHACVTGVFAGTVSAVVGRFFDKFSEQDPGHIPVTVGGAG
jgi:rod shape-determining protein MreD